MAQIFDELKALFSDIKFTKEERKLISHDLVNRPANDFSWIL